MPWKDLFGNTISSPERTGKCTKKKKALEEEAAGTAAQPRGNGKSKPLKTTRSSGQATGVQPGAQRARGSAEETDESFVNALEDAVFGPTAEGDVGAITLEDADDAADVPPRSATPPPLALPPRRRRRPPRSLRRRPAAQHPAARSPAVTAETNSHRPECTASTRRKLRAWRQWLPSQRVRPTVCRSSRCPRLARRRSAGCVGFQSTPCRGASD